MHFSFATGAYPGPRRVPIDVRALFYAVSAFDEPGRNGKEGAPKLASRAGLRGLDTRMMLGTTTRLRGRRLDPARGGLSRPDKCASKRFTLRNRPTLREP